MGQGNGREAKDFDAEALAAKPMTELQEHLLAWIKEKTGVTFTTKKEEAAFDLGVKYTVNFRTYHQASPENQKRLAANRAAAAEAEPTPAPTKAAKAPKAAPAKAAPAKKATKKAAPAPAEEAPAPAKPAKKVKPGAAKGATKAATEAPF